MLFATLLQRILWSFHADICACAFNALKLLECRQTNVRFAELRLVVLCRSKLKIKVLTKMNHNRDSSNEDRYLF